MTRTKFTSAPDTNIAGDHTVRSGKADVLDDPTIGRWGHPSGGLRSTARDLLRYARRHFGDTPVLRPDAVAMIAEPQVPLPPPGESQALSWFVRDLGAERLLMHAGGAIGQQSLLALCPRRHFALVVLTNSAVGNSVTGDVLARALELLLNIREAAPPRPVALRSDELGEYEGRLTIRGSDLVLTRQDQELSWRLENTGAPASASRSAACASRVLGSRPCGRHRRLATGQYGDFLRDSNGHVAYFRWSGRARPRS